jgi:hypothetical protein
LPDSNRLWQWALSNIATSTKNSSQQDQTNDILPSAMLCLMRFHELSTSSLPCGFPLDRVQRTISAVIEAATATTRQQLISDLLVVPILTKLPLPFIPSNKLASPRLENPPSGSLIFASPIALLNRQKLLVILCHYSRLTTLRSIPKPPSALETPHHPYDTPSSTSNSSDQTAPRTARSCKTCVDPSRPERASVFCRQGDRLIRN